METTLEWFLGAGIVTVLVSQFIAIVRSKTMKAIITTPPEPREAHVTATEATGKSTAPPEQQETSQHRSWLYRFFFGDQKT